MTYAGRLAWRVFYRADADAVYDATVDAASGDVLRVANMVKSEAPALVWERFPGNWRAARPRRSTSRRRAGSLRARRR